jgi:membrane-associated phospholipid phosphatase
MLAILLPVPAYWHDKQRLPLRDAALTLPWTICLVTTVSLPFLVAARLRLPLRDDLLMRMDGMLGVSTAAVHAWALHHRIGMLVSASYPLLPPLLAVAVLFPALLGRVKSARELLLANLIALAIAAPLFALVPAVGPWYPSHFAPSASQTYCQQLLFSMRAPGPYLFATQGSGVVCFPSFHVIWALLSARALWCFRMVRIPAAVLAGLIVLSTLTTGWHYFVDVLAGVVLAGISSAIAARSLQPILHDTLAYDQLQCKAAQ